MAFINYKSTENAETTFDASISASITTIIVHPGEGALFPSTFPFLLTFEKFNTNGQAIAREIVKVTGSPVTDQFTVVRQFGECVQDETADPKIQSNGPQVFDSGDKISLYNTAINEQDIKKEIQGLGSLYVSSTFNGVSNGGFTFSHNLGLLEDDVRQGRYIIYITGTKSGTYGIILGDKRVVDVNYFGGGLDIIYSFVDSPTSTTYTVNLHTNNIYIKMGISGNQITNCRLVIKKVF